MNRPPESYVHGAGVFVPVRAAAYLERAAGLTRLRLDRCGGDDELYRVLIAIRLAALAYDNGSSGTGTKPAPGAEPGPQLTQHVGVATAATRLGITERAVRKAIADGRLAATQVDGRWLIDPDELHRFATARAA